jgi:hypothetical protein
MRPVLYSDLTAAARALLAVPPPLRAQLCADLLQEADWADRFTRRLGRPHLRWGNGTLVAASAARAKANEPSVSDADYAACLGIVLAQILRKSATETCK